MFLYWKNIVVGSHPPKIVYAIIECPKGTQNKYEISKKANILILDRVLHSSVVYPHDYGFIPGTLDLDDDPLDILVLTSNPTAPLTLIEVRPVGVLVMSDERGPDYKIMAVNEHDPVFRDYEDIIQLPHHLLDEVKEFFRTYKILENPKYSSPKEWQGREAAYQIVNECIARFHGKFGDVKTIDPMNN